MNDDLLGALGAESEETVLVELDKQAAEILQTLDHSNIEVLDDEEMEPKEHPRAARQPLSDLRDILTDPEKQEEIDRACNHYVKHYIAYKCLQSIAANSANSYVSTLNEYVNYVESRDNDSFLEADWGDFLAYINNLIENGNRWKTFNGKILQLANFYRHIWVEFDCSPGIQIAQFKRLNPAQYKNRLPESINRDPLPREEMRMLVDATDSLRDALIVRTVYQAALRNSDVRNLKIQHFVRDRDNPLLKIRDSKFGKDRNVPITHELALDLEHWVDVACPPFSPYAPESAYLFPSKRDIKLSSNHSVWTIVHEAAVDAGIQRSVAELSDGSSKHRVDVHVLRHTGNTHWKQCDIGIEDRMKLLGHEDRDTTRGYSPDKSASWHTEFREKFNPAV